MYQRWLADPVQKTPWCVLLWGETGIGKTTSVRDRFGDSAYFLPEPSGSDLLRFEHLDVSRHRVLVIDEFDGWIPSTTLNILLDGTPFRCRQFSASSINHVFDWVVLLSNYSPLHWRRHWQKASTISVRSTLRRFLLVSDYLHTRDDLACAWSTVDQLVSLYSTSPLRYQDNDGQHVYDRLSANLRIQQAI